MLEEAEKEKYEKSAAGKNISISKYQFHDNILGGRHTDCHGSFTPTHGDSENLKYFVRINNESSRCSHV